MITISKHIWSPLATKIGKYIVDHAPQIAGYCGIGGFLAAIGLTYRNSADIHEAVEKKDYKTIVKKSLPIVAAAGASTIAIHYSCRESEKRLAAALLASNLLNAQKDELQTAIKETVGDKKAKAIEERVEQDKFKKATANYDESVIENTNHGTQLCLELDTGRLFYSDVAYIRSQINAVDADLNDNDRVLLSDFHEKLGLKTYDWANHVGWDRQYDRSLKNLRSSIILGSQIADNDEPIVTIAYRNHAVLSNNWGDGTYILLG